MSPKSFDRFMLDIEVAHHLKLRKLSDGEFKAFLVGVLPIAAKSEIRGALMIGRRAADAEDVAHQARVSKRTAQTCLEKLRDVGMLDRDDSIGADWVHDFDEWNPPPKVDKTAAARQRRARARARASGAAAPVTDRGVTPASRRDGVMTSRVSHANVTPPEVEVEVEGEETPPLPPVTGGSEKLKRTRPSFDKKPVTDAEWLLLVAVLKVFNARAGTSYEPLTENDELTQAGSRIVGARRALGERLTAEVAEAMIAAALAEPFWGSSSPHPKHVFAPGVREERFQAACKPRAVESAADIQRRKWAERHGEAA